MVSDSSTFPVRPSLARPLRNAVGRYRNIVRIYIAGLFVFLITVFLVLPTFLVIPMSLNDGSYLAFPPQGLTLKWYRAYFSDPDWMAATLFSLQVAFATAIVATTIGTTAALALAKSRFPLKGLLQSLALGPMIVPHVVLGVSLYLVFSPWRITGLLQALFSRTQF